MNPDRSIESEVDARRYVAQWADKAGMKRLERFVDMLLAENRQQNLISRPSEAHIWRRHIADSAQLLRYVSRETTEASRGPWLDLGTGAGFPGMVIAILRPDFRTVLVESRARRVEFLKNCTAELDLANCTVIGERLERIEPFESWVISARAFAPLEKLLRLSAPFSTKATHYILPKGRSAKHEWEQLKPSIRKVFHVERSLTDDEAGIIVRA